MTPEWVSAVGDLLGGLGVVIGLIFAWRQLSNWREQQVGAKQASLAEEVLLVAYQFDDLLRSARARYTTHHLKDGENLDDAYLRNLLERLSTLSNQLKDLRRAQIRILAVLDNKSIDTALSALNWVARDTIDAHRELRELKKVDDFPNRREEMVQLRRKAFGSYDDSDELGKRQIEAIDALKRELQPLISLKKQV